MTWTFSSRQSMSSALMAVEDDEEEVIVESDEDDGVQVPFPVSGLVEEETEEEMVLA